MQARCSAGLLRGSTSWSLRRAGAAQLIDADALLGEELAEGRVGAGVGVGLLHRRRALLDWRT